MTSAKYQSINIKVHSKLFKLQKTIKIILFDGWTKIITEYQETISELPNFNVGIPLYPDDIIVRQKFTKSLPHFTEA